MQDRRLILSLGLAISLVSSASLVSGCGGTPAQVESAKQEPKQDVKAKTAGTNGAAPTNSDENANAEGDPESDEEKKPVLSFAQLRTAALACPADDYAEIDSNCPGHETWFDSEAPAFADGKANAELLKMLASAEAKERILGTQKLRGTLIDHIDAKTVDILLDTAEKERNETVLRWMALLVTEQPLGKLGKLDRAITIAKNHAVEDYTVDFLFHAADDYRDPQIFAYAQEAAKSPTSAFRNAAIEVFSKFARENPADACKALDAYRSEKTVFNRDRAMYSLAGLGQCMPHADKVIDFLGKVELKKDLGFTVGQTMKLFCVRKEISQAQKDRVAKAAKRVTEGKDVTGHVRAYALEAVVMCDPQNGPAFAAKFKNDKDKEVAAEAAKHVK